MKLEIASAPPLKFLCSTSKAGTAFAVRKFGEGIHTCYLRDGSAKGIQKFIQWILFFLLQFPKKEAHSYALDSER